MHALCLHLVSIVETHFNLCWTYKYPMLRIAIRVAFVRTLTCRVKITGIGSEANRTSVKMLIAARSQYLSWKFDTRERTSVEKTNWSIYIIWVAPCISHRRPQSEVPYCLDRQTLKYECAEASYCENKQEHCWHSHVRIAPRIQDKVRLTHHANNKTLRPISNGILESVLGRSYLVPLSLNKPKQE